MAPHSYSSAWSGNTTAGFVAAFQEMSGKLVSEAGLTLVYSNAGDWSGVARPAGGYAVKEIFAFADSLQGSYPIYVMAEYGIANNTTSGPSIRFTVGNAHDGAGNLSGSLKTAALASGAMSGTGAAMGTSLPTYMCHGEGHFTLAFKANWSQNTPFIHVARNSDADGTPNGSGFTVLVNTQSSASTAAQLSHTAVRTASPAAQVYAAISNGAFSCWPLGLSGDSSDENGDRQVMPVHTLNGKMQQVFSAVCYLSSEVVQGTTFGPVVIKGSTGKTLLAFGNAAGIAGIGATDSRLAVIWQ